MYTSPSQKLVLGKTSQKWKSITLLPILYIFEGYNFRNYEYEVKHVHIPYILETNNTFVLGLELLVILYQANQPADPQLLNSNFCSILLFGIDKYLAGNAKNIIYPLLRMGMFIKQHPLENRIAEDIS